MAKRVLIIGGYGNFGSYIAKTLAREPSIQLIIGGRSAERAKQFIQCMESTALTPESAQLNIHDDVETALSAIQPDIVIHTSGPFQEQGYSVATACIQQSCHYIDLSDGRAFVNGISGLNTKAKEQGILVVSGASSVPCLSSSIIEHYQGQFSHLEGIDYGISTAQKTNRGEATTAAVLSYAGKTFKTLIKGKMTPVYGWQHIHRHYFIGLGSRFLGNCDIPDLDIFPKRYPNLRTIRFYAGLELPLLHIGLWGLSWLVRLGIISPLNKRAAFLLKISFLFDRFGTDQSAFYMRMNGSDKQGNKKELQFDLTAKSGDGPFIPCMPAILLAKKLAKGEMTETGAMPCVGLISLDEYLEALKPLDISWQISSQQT